MKAVIKDRLWTDADPCGARKVNISMTTLYVRLSGAVSLLKIFRSYTRNAVDGCHLHVQLRAHLRTMIAFFTTIRLALFLLPLYD